MKHGVDFEQAKELFNDDLLVIADTRFAYNEHRYIGYAKIDGKLMTVVYVERSPDIIRIISFKKANNREKQIFDKNRLG